MREGAEGRAALQILIRDEDANANADADDIWPKKRGKPALFNFSAFVWLRFEGDRRWSGGLGDFTDRLY